ncbi:hypothetical protein [Ruminococcus albus]|uniref:Lipoprotein n=1 Tax=Ruminococcus albus (strain ATCC 27210 / DSM 20455 / JCM 14654 / NCDO 2250 / 7) TaxID=697329 RepID=E6UIB5_RUMA7|nr:hypothetical protein [Ruminococcus albus]ADU22176.1 hypothetical protein Rumal_1676 [Ruminococcus albus 7 = DSM 20455]
MRLIVAAAAMAAVMLCGCTVTPQAEKNNSNKPVAREYEEKEAVVPELLTAHIDADDKEFSAGGPLVYNDFSVGDDFNFLDSTVNERQDVWTYNYWGVYDENDEKYRDLSFFHRTPYECTPYDIEEYYGGKSKPVSEDDDKLWQLASLVDNTPFLINISHAEHYFDYKYPFPEDSGRLGQYAGLRFYFDGKGQMVLAVMYLNDDLMPLCQVDRDSYTFRENYEKYSPEGCTLVPKVMLKGMESWQQLPADEAYPVLTFSEDTVKVSCRRLDGGSADGEGVLKSGTKMAYTETTDSVEFDLPSDGDSLTTYLSYNRYLDAYELHDPYWSGKYGCTLLMCRAK